MSQSPIYPESSANINNKRKPNQQIQQKLLLLKLKRIDELNKKLKQSLARDRMYASNASYSIINYVSNEKDYVLPELWGYMKPGENPLRVNTKFKQTSSGGEAEGGCCTIM